jgi:uncharacterized protein YoxC
MSRHRRGSRSEQLAPALFPFLAVLLCTMGALVLVLVLVVSQASASAKQALDEGQAAWQEVADVVEVVSAEMLARREQQQEAIDRKRSQLEAIEDHIQRLVGELKQLEETSRAIDDRLQLDEQQRQDHRQAIANVEARILEERQRLEQLQTAAANKPPAFAILPYQGSSGTSRRPIYLECTEQGVTIQPEGVLISLDDLKPPHGPGNPLDTSLRLIRSAYHKLDTSASIASAPYPLLLVRPDGIRAYVLARAAMSGWDDQFGYELIDQQLPLAFPASIPGLKPQLISNLEVARQRQAALIAAMPRRYQQATPWDETLEDIDGEASLGHGVTSPREQASGSDWTAVDRAVETDASKWSMVRTLPGANGRPLPSSGASSSPAEATADGWSPAASTTAQAWPPPQELQVGGGSSGDGQAGSSDNRGGLVGAPEGVPKPGFTQPQPHLPPSPPPDAEAPLSGLSLSNTAQAMPSADPRNQSLSQENRPTADPTAASSMQTERERNGTENPTASLPIASTPSNSGGEATSHGTTTARSWTASRRVTNGTAVSRPMTFVVMPDRWFLMEDDRPGKVEKVIALQAGPAEARRKLEEAIDARVEAWGVAVAGGYWAPKLVLQLAPQAELSAQRFQKLMEGSELSIELQPLP